MRLGTFGIEVEIRLTKELEFRANVGDKRFQTKEVESLKSLIREEVQAQHMAVWLPVIKIDYGGETHSPQKADFKIEYDRFYYAEVGDSTRIINWARYEHLMEEKKEPDTRFSEWSRSLIGNSSPHYGKMEDNINTRVVHFHKMRNGEEVVLPLDQVTGVVYRPYTEELWAGLEALREALNLANCKISDLISTDKGLKTLASGTRLMLTEGAKP
jgi:hypothetical protein